MSDLSKEKGCDRKQARAIHGHDDDNEEEQEDQEEQKRTMMVVNVLTIRSSHSIIKHHYCISLSHGNHVRTLETVIHTFFLPSST